MALQEGINCYVNSVEADFYFEDRLDATVWNAASDERREQALVTATNKLENESWAGVAMSETQSLAFPRVGTYFEPKLGMDISFPSDVPDRIKIATYELAYHLLNNENLQDNTGDVHSIHVGPIKLIDIGVPETPNAVYSQIKPMLQNNGSKIWWRAN